MIFKIPQHLLKDLPETGKERTRVTKLLKKVVKGKEDMTEVLLDFRMNYSEIEEFLNYYRIRITGILKVKPITKKKAKRRDDLLAK